MGGMAIKYSSDSLTRTEIQMAIFTQSIPFRCPRNHQGTLCHLAWLLGCNRFVVKTCENKQFEEVKLRSVER